MRRVARKITHPLITTDDFKKHAKVGITTITKHFGSWRKAFEKAGLRKRFNFTSSQKTNKELLAELRSVARKNRRRTVSSVDLLLRGSISPVVFRRRFGSWPKALEAAGLSVAPSGRRYSDDDCFANLQRVWTHFGREPRSHDMRRPPSTIGDNTYATRFGSWRKALRTFVNHMNRKKRRRTARREKEPAAETTVKLPRPRRREPGRIIPIGLRYRILNRNRFRCQLCGNSPAIDVMCRLHVDHIKPFSKGGKTVGENLRTLCANCNIGRSNRYKN